MIADWRSFERMLPIFAFLFLTIPLALGLTVIVPPGYVADEPAHALRADALTHGQIIGVRHQATATQPAAAGVFADPALLAAAITPDDVRALAHNPLESGAIAAHRAIGWTHSVVFMQIDPLAIYAPVFYVPGAVGIEAARAFGLSPWDAYRFGRLANVLVYAIFGFLALLIAERGRMVLFVLLSLPMTVALAASFSQDGVLIPASALAAAALTHRCGAMRALGLVLLSLVCLAKPAYLPLVGLALLPLPAWADRPGWMRGIGTGVLVALPALIWFGFAAATVAVPQPRSPYAAGPLWTGTAALFHACVPAAQIQVLLAHPLTALRMVVASLLAKNVWYSAIGALGWLDILLPRPFYALWTCALFCALCLSMLDRGQARPSDAGDGAVVAFLIGVCLVLVSVWEYLSWTNVGATQIDGIEGRYLLPALMPLALLGPLLRRGEISTGLRIARLILTVLPVAVAAASLATVPVTVAAHFVP